MLRKIIVGIVGSVLVFVISLTPLFVYGWVEHTQLVQEWIAEDYADFAEKDINWKEFDIDADPTILLDQLREVLVANTMILRIGGVHEANKAYMDTIYELIGILARADRGEGLDRSALIHGVFEATEAQVRLELQVEKVTSNTLYAMRYTF